MRVVLDTCVLYPPVLREVLLGVAQQGLFEPIWSNGILAEWRNISARDGAVNATLVQGEIARLNALWPDATQTIDPNAHPDLYLPDPDDVHVLAAARQSGAATIVTANLRDFPRA